MKVLISCEESQTICKEFRKLNIEAYSCDIQDCSGGYPEWHIKRDALKEAYSGKYDLMIAHPPCTYLSRAGARWLYGKEFSIVNWDRYEKMMEARRFFFNLYKAPIKYICLENPTPFKLAKLPNFHQAIQPYQFGHKYSKRTLLWLKNLPKLRHTSIVNDHSPYLPSNTGAKSCGRMTKEGITHKSSNGTAWSKKDASKTFEGIAIAMAEQWSSFIIKREKYESIR
jgi:hypothetical protein